MYAQAGHCYEEVLLHQPSSIPTHVQYADVLYTLGGASSQRLAQTHYAAAIKLSQGANVRALFGVCACAAQLSTVKVRMGLRSRDVLQVACVSLIGGCVCAQDVGWHQGVHS